MSLSLCSLYNQIVDQIVHKLGGGDHEHLEKHETHQQALNGSNKDEQEIVIPHCVGCSDDPIAELVEWHMKAEQEEQNKNNRISENGTHDMTLVDNEYIASKENPPNNVIVEGIKEGDPEEGQTDEKQVSTNKDTKSDHSQSDLSSGSANEKIKDAQEKQKLIRMGLSTALAIAIHNFPEGLATFVAALDDPKVGAVLAVALGIHNIPEGLCVALPVYYATGNRLKGFMWGLVSGLTEPIGALLGWLVLAKLFVAEVYAILFGIVAGMMTYISFRELIPTAFRYDPKDSVVTFGVVLGMFVMALSLVLFQL